MVESNGRWKRPLTEGDNPDMDFPIRQEFTDCLGEIRQFVISYFPARLGFGVLAEEERKESEGFLFREFDATSPYLALGRIRRRIERALATRHIQEHQHGVFQAKHTTLRGRVSYSEDEVAFVIDRELLTLEQFGKLIETFEGFEFGLDFQD